MLRGMGQMFLGLNHSQIYLHLYHYMTYIMYAYQIWLQSDSHVGKSEETDRQSHTQRDATAFLVLLKITMYNESIL